MALNRGFVYTEQIDGPTAGERVLDHLSRCHRHSSLEGWRRRLESGEIFLDGVVIEDNVPLKPGQELAWHRPPWEEPEVPLDYAVLHLDRDLLVVAKPSGLPTLPGGGFLDHTLLARVRRAFPEATPAHRLGRATSGIVVFARSAMARSRLSEAMRRREVVKVYRALASGVPARNHLTMETRIGPVFHPTLGTVHAASPEGKTAISRVRLLERRRDCALLEVEIETGRPHQIRIHLAAAGHPLVGDPLYATGGGIREEGVGLPGDSGYRLHAERVRLGHPATGALVCFWCPPPPELRLISEG
ncbi:MAG: pseudouridine synthase [Syntrophobacteraceae bacterium]|jgi:23S rRNA pseudouridine1911/1915/1917 synthase|nr:pseudouridine synthase [Syntrophobacteraceae bacterium]